LAKGEAKEHRLIDPSCIKSLRKDEKAYKWFMDKIVKKVTGVKLHDKRGVWPVSQWLTVSSETFAIAAYHNYHQHAVEMARKNHVTTYPPFTEQGRTAKKGQGWNQDGLNFLREVRKIVLEDRKNPDLRKVDDAYFEFHRARVKADGKSKKREATRQKREEGWDTLEEDKLLPDEEESSAGGGGWAAVGPREDDKEEEVDDDNGSNSGVRGGGEIETAGFAKGSGEESEDSEEEVEETAENEEEEAKAGDGRGETGTGGKGGSKGRDKMGKENTKLKENGGSNCKHSGRKRRGSNQTGVARKSSRNASR